MIPPSRPSKTNLPTQSPHWRPVRRATTYAKTDRLEHEPEFDLIAALTFPFREPGWLAKLCIAALVSFIPLVSLVVLRGWRLEITARSGRRRLPILPSWGKIGTFLWRGLVLWFMTGLYAVPQLILLAIVAIGKHAFLVKIAMDLYSTLTSQSGAVSLFGLAMEIGLGVLGIFALPITLGLVMYPFYRVAMLRYALTNRASAFFSLRSNWRLATKHLSSIFALFFFELLVKVLFAFFGGILAPIGIGLLLLPALFLPASYWMTGYLFGTAANRMYADIRALESRRP